MCGIGTPPKMCGIGAPPPRIGAAEFLPTFLTCVFFNVFFLCIFFLCGRGAAEFLRTFLPGHVPVPAAVQAGGEEGGRPAVRVQRRIDTNGRNCRDEINMEIVDRELLVLVWLVCG